MARAVAGPEGRSRHSAWIGLLLLALLAFPASSTAQLPKRLILVIDAIPYRDMKAFQEGVTCKDRDGQLRHRRGFHEVFFPVSRLVSTFPSTSDVAWTEIFGCRPPPGYQRTYFSCEANRRVFINALTTPVEYEKQMTWRVKSGWRHAMGYVLTRREFERELHELVEDFLGTSGTNENYYALMLSPDDALHMAVDIFALLSAVDEELHELRARYRAREGRELELLILSDHGNNHAGHGKRVPVRAFLKKAGYRIRQSLRDPKDVVLPTAGIESWVEVHNAPSETLRLAELLSHMEGVDVVTARHPTQDHRFLVLNAEGNRALIDWHVARNAFRYTAERGDPIDHQPVVDALSRRGQLDSEGFASADAWMAETLAHRYPVALERIARAHTRVTLNPATMLISLKNDYVHAAWLVRKGSKLVPFGGTHGALDDLNSTGMLLCNFAPTTDTTSARAAALFGGFPGLRDFRENEEGAEWITSGGQAMTTCSRGPVDWTQQRLPDKGVFLRVWTPHFTRAPLDAGLELTMSRIPSFAKTACPRGDPGISTDRHLVLSRPIPLGNSGSYERVYGFPGKLALEPEARYRISGQMREGDKLRQIFQFSFLTNRRGEPVAY